MLRKFMRNKMRSTFAKVKDRYKAYAKAERKEKRKPVSFETYLGVDEKS